MTAYGRNGDMLLMVNIMKIYDEKSKQSRKKCRIYTVD